MASRFATVASAIGLALLPACGDGGSDAADGSSSTAGTSGGSSGAPTSAADDADDGPDAATSASSGTATTDAPSTSESSTDDTGLPPYDGVFPGETWEQRTPAEVGLDAATLDAIAAYLEGRGVVVRSGYLVYTWGDAAATADVASAFKPFNTHFLLRAIEQGLLDGYDDAVVDHWPCLDTINADLGYKDRGITFRHLATQTSDYGVVEAPGTAFDYNDWQQALFSDALVLAVYGAPSWDDADAMVFWPELGDALQFEDGPSFLGNYPGRVRISPRDFARFGLLYLARGRWADQQILDEAHATLVVSDPLPVELPRAGFDAAEMCPDQRTIGSMNVPDNQTDHHGSYSWLWWTNGVRASGLRLFPSADPDVFCALGHQHGMRGLLVVPNDDIVVSWNDTVLDQKPWPDETVDPHPLDEVFRLLHEAVE
jgi:hypothetical protein